MPFNDISADLLGAGSYGIVVSDASVTVKLFYDMFACPSLRIEARIQETARNLLQEIVRVPRVHEVFTHPIQFRDHRYLCGISMDRVPLVSGMPSATHILLGYDQPDLDSEWSRDYTNPVSEATNPTRGFHAGPDMLEAIWEDEGRSPHEISIESVAATMGLALRTLIDGGIIPFDLEWIYGGDGNVYLIDFGLCAFGTVEPMHYLAAKGSWGLGADYYIPHKGDRGYNAFMRAFTLSETRDP